MTAMYKIVKLIMMLLLVILGLCPDGTSSFAVMRRTIDPYWTEGNPDRFIWRILSGARISSRLPLPRKLKLYHSCGGHFGVKFKLNLRIVSLWSASKHRKKQLLTQSHHRVIVSLFHKNVRKTRDSWNTKVT